jgi:dihydroxy-acid dehydratase
VVTDGHLSGLVNKTLLVCEICPEAADGGPIALVENGDVISIDVKKKVANLEVPEDELAGRRARLQKGPEKDQPGWLGIYKRVVKPLSDGAVLVD